MPIVNKSGGGATFNGGTITGGLTVTGSPIILGGDPSASVGFYGNNQTQAGPISNASGGATIDTQARAAINSLLTELRTYGLIGA